MNEQQNEYMESDDILDYTMKWLDERVTSSAVIIKPNHNSVEENVNAAESVAKLESNVEVSKVAYTAISNAATSSAVIMKR